MSSLFNVSVNLGGTTQQRIDTGLSAEELRQATEAAVRGATGPLIDRITEISKTLGVTVDAAKTLLKIVGEDANIPDDKLAEALTKVAGLPVDPAAPVGFSTKAIAVSNITIGVPEHFMGRAEELAAIEAALQRDKRCAAVTALHGLRGVGKTVLAVAYAVEHRSEYRATWWVGAQTESTMRADLVALGVKLGWIEADAKEEPALNMVMERLRREGEGILLIFDNAVEDHKVRPYLPRSGAARILITSNSHFWRGIAEPVGIRVWPKDTGADFLIARSGTKEDRSAAEELSEALGGLPLAHEQAGAYCEYLGVSLAEYLRRFKAAPITLLDDEDSASPDYGRTVAKTFALAIDAASERYPAAEPLIVYAAMLAPEPIPLFIFSEAREEFGQELAIAFSGDGLDKAVAALRTFALIEYEPVYGERDPTNSTTTIRLHWLVREVAAGRRVGKAREDFGRALLKAVVRVFPDDILNFPETWPRVRQLDRLALAIVVDAEPTPNAQKLSAYLMNALAIYRLKVFGAYAEAGPLLERALELRSKALGTKHPDTVQSIENLGGQRHAVGDFGAARSLFERALAIR